MKGGMWAACRGCVEPSRHTPRTQSAPRANPASMRNPLTAADGPFWGGSRARHGPAASCRQARAAQPCVELLTWRVLGAGLDRLAVTARLLEALGNHAAHPIRCAVDDFLHLRPNDDDRSRERAGHVDLHQTVHIVVAATAAGIAEANDDAMDELTAVRQHELQASPRMVSQFGRDPQSAALEVDVHVRLSCGRQEWRSDQCRRRLMPRIFEISDDIIREYRRVTR